MLQTDFIMRGTAAAYFNDSPLHAEIYMIDLVMRISATYNREYRHTVLIRRDHQPVIISTSLQPVIIGRIISMVLHM